MKIAALVIPILLCVLLIFIPVLQAVGLVMGLTLVLASDLVIAIIQAVIAVGCAIAIFVIKPEYGTAGKLFWTLALPISLLNSLCFADSQSIIAAILALIWSGAVFAVFMRFVPDSGFKATSAVLSVLLTVAFAVIFLVFGIFAPIVKERTVHSTIDSPSGDRSAEVVSVSTPISTKMCLDIKHNEPKINIFIAGYYDKSVTLYEGSDYETKTAKISWKDENTVIINGAEYPID